MSNIITFGKYKDQPIEVLIHDPEYCQWLMAQSWFNQKFPNLKTIIINNFKEPTHTPEHNKMQAEFLKDDFCVAFLKRVFPSFFENPARLTNDWHFKFGENLQRLFITKRSFELAGVDVCLSFTLEFEQTMDLFEDKTFNYLGKDSYQTPQLKIEVKPTVGDDYPAILRQMKASKSNILYLAHYNGIGVDETLFRQYFANEKIKVIFQREID